MQFLNKVLVSLAIFDLLSFSPFNKECAMRTAGLCAPHNSFLALKGNDY